MMARGDGREKQSGPVRPQTGPLRGSLPMRSEILLAVCALGWAVLPPRRLPKQKRTPPAQVEPPERPARQRPGEYPDYLFREPHPAPVAETSEEFREKYLLGDWLGARPDLAGEGIRP